MRPPYMDGEDHVLESLYAALDQQPSSVHIHESLLEVWSELGDEGNKALLNYATRSLDKLRLTKFDSYGIWNCCCALTT